MPHPVEYVLDRGLLPRGGHRCARTQCLWCKQPSPHEAWYRYPSNHGPARQRGREREATS